MQEFYDEGISKIKDLADENLTVILDRLKALTSDEISYDTYSGRSDSMNGLLSSSLRLTRSNN